MNGIQMMDQERSVLQRKKVCIVGASGKLGKYMVQHALDRGYEVVGVCREESVGKLKAFVGRITIIFMVEALENDELIRRAPAIVGCQTASALAHASERLVRPVK